MNFESAGRLAGVAARKDDHIKYALEQQNQQTRTDFDDVEFLHHALAGIDYDSVDLNTEVAGSIWASPLYINAMTGGTDTAYRVNATLAEACAATGTALASGSVGIAIDAPETAASFRVLRQKNPNGFIFANIGAGRSVDDAKRAVDLLAANALQVHLNAVQETVMPEGERNFSAWLPLLEQIVAGLDVPVVIKEVGFGLSRRTLNILREIGVQFADIAGVGGTNFALIEAARRPDGYADLAHFGHSAVCNLLDAPEFDTLLASGGVRKPIDALKLLALGARAVGVAGSFLELALKADVETVTQQLDWWITRMRELCALLGAADLSELLHTDMLIRGRVREYCQLRGIDATAFARRSQ